MSRFGGLSEERPSVFKTPSKLGTHLSTQCSGDERQSRPCPARYYNPRTVVWKHDTLPLDPIRVKTQGSLRAIKLPISCEGLSEPHFENENNFESQKNQ
ncbi:hypothetical protein TNCV_104431 [Trichonephila clavipes]|nr:hypothetical protein TNCV_104431 [Trichonephila clavipes]